MAIFMKYEGIDGESEVRSRRGFIELQGFAWGIGRATTTARGDARGDAEVMTREVTLTRVQDSVTALLIDETATNAFDRTVEIEFVRTGANNKPTTYLKFRFLNAGLSSYAIDASGSSQTETLALRYTAFSMESHKTGDDLSAVPNTAGYDTAAGQRI